jgi:hypothetical protein
MQYNKTAAGKFEPLAQKNVDKIVEKIVEAAIDNLLVDQLKMGDKSGVTFGGKMNGMMFFQQ